ncbi:hypothetical protein N5C38_20185 [Pseudomonas chengduensis]|jgi:hypothetical protein|nr:hypothetical protein [Pseudomonas chengduensis]MDH1213366.1 hypothetical protein [Pseudomonas chengduensis]MDH1282755.1 hypothetical protein [Pseudomonas chengduensis]MDH1667681.1 hypothetical protein [Pseudomonas chengduensis]
MAATCQQVSAVLLFDTPKNMTGKRTFQLFELYFSHRRIALGDPAGHR